ncbi:MAG: hypothetical protein ACI4EH_07070 [Oliverpabstia sp.]
MLDLFFSHKIYESVINNSNCKNKFLSFYLRQALFLAVTIGMFLLLIVFTGKLHRFQAILLALVWLVISLVSPLLLYIAVKKMS